MAAWRLQRDLTRLDMKNSHLQARNPPGESSRAGPGLELRWPASAIWHSDEPEIQTISIAALREALRLGYRDFIAVPSHALFVVIAYPILGLLLARMAFGYDTLHLVFPLAAGFALIGPVAALGLYELSRRREQGLNPVASDALSVLHSPAIGAITLLGLVLLLLFAAWMVTAQSIYTSHFGSAVPATIADFINQVLYTSRGRNMILVGMTTGLVFAIVVLLISAISFPMLLDRNVSAATAVRTSIRAVIENPAVMALWGIIIAFGLLLGSLPLFFGLAFVIPVLGHATWHLYRKLVAR
jgi:uncharacterized membrane protein